VPASQSPQPRAIILLSGGLDSTTCLAMAKQQGFACYALSFRYGQRHTLELQAAQRVAQQGQVEEHVIADIDLRLFGGSALTDELEVPKDRPLEQMEESVPITYVPARNTIFLSFALAWAEVLECSDIFIGVNALDYSGYPDCRPEFIESFEKMARLATRAGTELEQPLNIHTPLMKLSKAEIIEAGMKLGVDYSITTSCYDPQANGQPCGACDACQLRNRGFAQLGLTDPCLN